MNWNLNVSPGQKRISPASLRLQTTGLTIYFTVLAERKCVKCLSKEQKREPSSISAHFLSRMCFRLWLYPLKLLKPKPTPFSTVGLSLWRTTFSWIPPFSVSLHQNGHPGQLQVSWYTNVSKYWKDDVMYKIHYFSKILGGKIKEAKESVILDSLVPGEEVEVKVTVKCALNPNAGHWSSWSHPVRAMVPQSADDISLKCYTSDLQNISCQWNGNRYSKENEYKLFHKMGFSKALGWTEWTECLADRDLTELCRFRGDKSRKVRVKLSSTSAPLGRTFYTQDFTLNNSIKTSPPCHLRGALEKDKFCLKWKAPLLSLSAHLQYEVSYQIRGAEAWMTVSLKGPETHGTCLDVPAGSWYNVKVRAKPTGSIYSGYWSDWSDVLTGNNPPDIGTLLWVCIPVSMLIIAIILICLFPTYLSKLKLYFWPPVPNLDIVLQRFLTEINGPRWALYEAALCFSSGSDPGTGEENVVEVMVK
ncbi:hypothetical protein EPR50_G00101730 [Perca flavescens]|uniref:Fibronectin type-III domain-containing protein n=1 Tax=Perca flavescens TaxID=8167 RepID=A0A484D1Y1_PERFV|nr:hypothetical protein EPR50_G00101730 [Perca flavescens]